MHFCVDLVDFPEFLSNDIDICQQVMKKSNISKEARDRRRSKHLIFYCNSVQCKRGLSPISIIQITQGPINLIVVVVVVGLSIRQDLRIIPTTLAFSRSYCQTLQMIKSSDQHKIKAFGNTRYNIEAKMKYIYKKKSQIRIVVFHTKVLDTLQEQRRSPTIHDFVIF